MNSEKRANRLRQEIEKRLGILAVHQGTVTQTPEAMLEKRGQRRAAGRPASKRSDGPAIDPEVMQRAEAEMQRLVESWAYQKIPALGGRTPVEAVRDPDGKEVVEALLLGWERQNENEGDPESSIPTSTLFAGCST